MKFHNFLQQQHQLYTMGLIEKCDPDYVKLISTFMSRTKKEEFEQDREKFVQVIVQVPL